MAAMGAEAASMEATPLDAVIANEEVTPPLLDGVGGATGKRTLRIHVVFFSFFLMAILFKKQDSRVIKRRCVVGCSVKCV